jgi:serine/threonine-protein kinase
MSNEERLEQLLDLWEESHEQGDVLPPEELCRDCPELLEQLKQRIRCLQAIDSFMQVSTLPYEDAPLPVELGALAGLRYRPLRFLDRGGLGELYIALDEELRREVALKRLRRQGQWDREQQTCFLVEAEITGKLEHPGVVPVYGMGRDAQGQPYYAMRFIRGQTLDQAVEEFHRVKTAGQTAGDRSLAFQKLVRSILSVCQTVAYAHSRRVIHRDIKPQNIMLGKYGENLLVDWGLAKLLRQPENAAPSAEDSVSVVVAAKVEQTAAGRIKGSPAYMSPEQAAGKVEEVRTASDIYSLGATLYKLLTGLPPVQGQTLSEILEKVKAGHFPPPRQVNPAVPPALEAVCLKAMRLRPQDRYASALALAEDIEHWLADEPVSAGREPLAVRARWWLRRHQTGATAAVVGLVVTVVAAVGLAAQARYNTEMERSKNDELRRAYADLKLAKAQVEKNYENARGAVLGLAAYALRDPRLRRELSVVLPPAERAGHQQVEQGLEEARLAFQVLLLDHPDDRETRADLASICQLLGEIRQGLGRPEPARQALAEARQGFEGLLWSAPKDPQTRLGLALVHFSEGKLLLLSENVKQMESLLGSKQTRTFFKQAERAAPIFEQARVILEELVKENPTSRELRFVLADVWNALGTTQNALLRPQAALPWCEKSSAALDELTQRYPEVAEYRHDCDRAHYGLGYTYLGLALQHAEKGRSDQARTFSEKAQAQLGPWVRKHTQLSSFRTVYNAHLQLWGVLLRDQAVGLVKKNRTAEAWRLFEQALPVWEEWASAYPAEKSVQEQLNFLRLGLADTSRARVVGLDAAKAVGHREISRILRAGLEALDRLPASLRNSEGIIKLQADLHQRLASLPAPGR